MLEVIEAYRILYGRYGLIRITREMIGFTREGIVKCWVNGNFGKNSPEMYAEVGSESLLV